MLPYRAVVMCYAWLIVDRNVHSNMYRNVHDIENNAVLTNSQTQMCSPMYIPPRFHPATCFMEVYLVTPTAPYPQGE